MATLLYRLGAFAARRRWAIVAAWLVVLIGVGSGALAFKGTMSDSFTIPGTEAQQALNQLAAKLPAAGGATGRIVFEAPSGATVTTGSAKAQIADVVGQVQKLPGVLAVVDPATAKTVSPNGRLGIMQVQFAGQLTAIPQATQQSIADIAARHRIDGLQIELAGGAVKQVPGAGSSEGLGVVVALVVLLITFGSIAAAGMNMLTALIGVGVGLAGILWASGGIQMSSTAPILALMLGLAVGIDYALFLISRHRQQLVAGLELRESIARATGTAGSAVVFAGLTVLIALAGLSVVGVPFLTVMGLAAAGTVAIAVLIAITLLPALLSLTGDKILSKKLRAQAHRAREAGADLTAPHVAKEPGGWIRFVTRRPAAVVVGVIAVMGVIAIPALKLHLALPNDGSAATDSTQYKAYNLISANFGPGYNGPLIVTVAGDPAAVAAAKASVVKDISSVRDVAIAVPGALSKDGTLAVLQVLPKTGPSDEATEQLVRDLRAAAPAWESATHTDIAVTGQTAVAIDVSDKLAKALPIYLIIVVGLALILLLLVFRSIVVPIKAALGFLLSISVSFGAVVAVYQWGWLGAILGVDNPAPIVSFLPILLIGVLFGLAMDYQVFMVAGMREAYVHGAAPKLAVKQGFTAGSRVVVAAAIIMTSVFSGFILSPNNIIASIGFSLGIGVLADAFLVRMTLVPAVMTLLGRTGWYLPRWLDKALPRVDIEGEQLLRRLELDRELAGAADPELASADR